MCGKPVPLRKVPFITGWSVDEVADFLTDKTMFRFELLTPHEWRKQDEPRRVSMENMGEILKGIKEEPDKYAQLARFPAHFFVYEANLACAFDNTCNPGLYAGYEGRCPFHLDWNPSVHPYEDLIDECPDFSPSPSQRELRKQATAKRNAGLKEKAKALRAQHPDKKETWIASRIVAKDEAEGLDSETVRKIIRTK